MSGDEPGLSGFQIKAIREALGESQKKFASRIAVTQPVISRLEQKIEPVRSPETILIQQIAAANGINIPRGGN